MGEIININNTHSPAADQVSSGRTFLGIRSAILYMLMFTGIAAVVSYLFVVPIIPGNVNLKLIIIPAFSYLLLGVLFVGFLYSKHGFLNRENVNGGLQYGAAVFVCIFCAILLTGFTTGNGSVLTSLFYSCIFLFPYVVYQTWICFTSLYTSGSGKIWYLPEHANRAPATTVSLNNIRIKIKVPALDGTQEKFYETTVPGKLSLGTAFTNMVSEDREAPEDRIEFRDVNRQPFGWQFFTSDFFGLLTRPLDPDLSLSENSIKDNSIIIARRIQKQYA